MNNAVSYDVIIVGGGFAALTAAHWLGRFHRRTLVLTSGPSRNARSHAVHGYPGYEGADPVNCSTPCVVKRSLWIQSYARKA